MRKKNKFAALFLCAALTLSVATPVGVNASDLDNPKMYFTVEEGKEKEPLRLQIKGENTPTFKYGKTKKLELTLKNSGEEKIQNITVTPKVTTGIKNWPFEIEKVSYEQEIESVKGKESVDLTFSVTPRQEVESKYYKVMFYVSYGDKTLEQSVFVKLEGKPKEEKPSKDPEEKPNGNQNQGGHVDNYPPVDLGGDVPPSDLGGSGGGSGETVSSTLTPRVIVTGFSTEPEEVKAGTNFKLIVHLKNTSKKTAVKNMLFDFNAPSEGSDENTTSPAFLPSSGSSVVYLDSIKANGKKDISIDMNAKSDLVQKPYSIDLSMKYEDGNGGQFESDASISVPVKQDARFEFSEFEMSSDVVELGSECNIMCNLYNLGRVKLYNVKAKFEGEGLQSKELFVGNVEPGATAAIDGMVTGESVTTGDGSAKLVISYEDETGAVSTAEKELILPVVEPVVEENIGEDPSVIEQEEKKGFPVIPVVIGIAVVAAIVAIVLVKKHKQKKRKEEEEELLEDELNRLTEDE